MEKRYIAPSVKKAFEILRVVSQSRRGMRVSELARELKMAKSTVHGIASALEELGALVRAPLTKKYKIGPTLLELGKAAFSQIDVKDLARPSMEDLMERTEESVFLGVLNGDRVTILDIVESMKELKITSPRGTAISIFAGATGKVFLASMEEERAIEIIRAKELPSFTKNTISDPEKYLEEIRRVRQAGYATDEEEYILGVRAVAAPIRGEGRLNSAIWVVGFKAGLDEKRMESLIRETRAAAAEISRKIAGSK
jgi:IclR family KDG regulon transcriptional repressor